MTETPTLAQTRIERQRLWLGAMTLLLFFAAFAVTLNRLEGARLRSDLYLRWYATTQLLANGRNLYDPQNAVDVNLVVYGVPEIELQPGFFYPAHLLLVTVPLALLPYAAAHLIWTFLVQVFQFVGTAVVIRQAKWPRGAVAISLFVGVTTLYVPSMQHTIWGQFNTIGVASLGLCFVALRRQRYALAGALAVGMTLKPHPYVLALLFLAGWALVVRARRPFLVGMAAAGGASWLFAELFQPGWVRDFLAALGGYLPSQSVIDKLWNPYQLVSATLVVATLALCWRQRRAGAESAAFAGCLALTTAVTALVVPIVGMMHVVALLVPLALLLAHYRQQNPAAARWMAGSFGGIYLLGWLVFVWGLVGSDLYGQHINWAESVNKAWLPLLLAGWALPLVWRNVQRGKEERA